MKLGQRIRINRDVSGGYARWAISPAEARNYSSETTLPYGVYEAVVKDSDGVLLAAVLSSDYPSSKHRYLVIEENLEGLEVGSEASMSFEERKND